MVSEIAQTDNFNDKTNIKVVGVGGAGGNAVNRMIAERSEERRVGKECRL